MSRKKVEKTAYHKALVEGQKLKVAGKASQPSKPSFGKLKVDKKASKKLKGLI